MGGEAVAKVGVTSATDGDPLGKPPSENERVLRIGVDVQANELVTTSATDRAHLVFLDGSSLTVGPNAQLTIDRFVYDPATKTGDLAISASKGVLRLVGGKISKTRPITITTPSSTIGIRGGITFLDVTSNETVSTFVFGVSMVVTGAGFTQTATRPGSQITTMLGGRPGQPTIVAQGALSAQLRQLEGKSGPGSTGSAPDQAAQASGFSNVNSAQVVRITGLRPGDSFGTGPGPRNRNPNDTVVTAITNANETAPSQQPTPQNQSQSQQEQQQGLPPIPPPPEFNFGGFTFEPGTTITTVSELSKLALAGATATYSGQMLGFTNTNPNQVIGGTYQNVWSFGSRNGTATVTFDNSKYGGGSAPNTFLVNNTAVFRTNAGIQSTSGPPGRTLTLDGIFLSAPNNPAKHQAGAFTVTGPNNYTGGGAFVGTK